MRRVLPIVLMVVGGLLALGGGAGLVMSDDDTPPAASRATTTSTSSTTTTAPAETAEQFYLALGNAFTANDESFLFARLHAAVLQLYGEDQCRQFLADLPGRSFEVVNVAAPAPWNFGAEREGRDLVIPDAVAVELIQRIPGREDARLTGHVAPGADRTLRWFTDCGTALAA